jgi:uncharacterized protein YkuJ
MDEKSFQDFSGTVGSNVVNETKQNSLVKEGSIICDVCWQITETVDFVRRTKDRNQVLFDVIQIGFLPRPRQMRHPKRTMTYHQ